MKIRAALAIVTLLTTGARADDSDFWFRASDSIVLPFIASGLAGMEAEWRDACSAESVDKWLALWSKRRSRIPK